jgi:hypothetical protein
LTPEPAVAEVTNVVALKPAQVKSTSKAKRESATGKRVASGGVQKNGRAKKSKAAA